MDSPLSIIYTRVLRVAVTLRFRTYALPGPEAERAASYKIRSGDLGAAPARPELHGKGQLRKEKRQNEPNLR